MGIDTIAGAAMLMQNAQVQQNLSVSLVKMNAEFQSGIVNMLAQTAEQTPQPAPSSDYNFSIRV